ncbi:DNA polymerase zeta [Coemansia sp. BCRC 34301]|nr:DNA polymerase zeta [Coemansia sp. BCRC 34301]
MIAYNYCFSTCLGSLEQTDGDSDTCIGRRLGFTYVEAPAGMLSALKDKLTVSPNSVLFVKPAVRRGLLGQMLNELLESRVMLKNAMKQWGNSDEPLFKKLDAWQLGLKLIANATYGYAGASFSGRMPCVEIADAIVQAGRETLESAIQLIHSKHAMWGARVVYGDTDSVFIHLSGKSRHSAFRIGQEIADAVTKMNPAPIKLKFEKVHQPCVLLTKKRYAGWMYTAAKQCEPLLDAKGMELVRCDGCIATQRILEGALDSLFRTNDLSLVKSYVTNEITRLLCGDVPFQKFIVAKEVAADAMEIDPRMEPQYGERVPYVVVSSGRNARLVDQVIRPHQLLQRPELPVNSQYYVDKQVVPALSRVLSLIGVDVRAWVKEIPRRLRGSIYDAALDAHSDSEGKAGLDMTAAGAYQAGPPLPSRRATLHTLDHFYYKQRGCFLCGQAVARVPPPPGSARSADPNTARVCDDCRADTPAMLASVGAIQKEADQALKGVYDQCATCVGGLRADALLAAQACDCLDYLAMFQSAPVKRAAVIPDSPHEFLSCSEDGTVRHFDIRERPPSTRLGLEPWQRGGRIVADYHKLRAELHALDINVFQPSIFAVGGSLTSIMVHDRRMPCSGLAHAKWHTYDTNWAGDQCVVRLRRDRLSSKHTIHEKISDSTVTGLRFSRDVPNLVIGSWCYDHVYLFDLNHSSTFTSAVRGEGCLLSQVRERDVPSDTHSVSPLVKRVRSNEPAHEYILDADSSDGAEDETASLHLFRASRGVHGFGRGQSYGMRFLRSDEAPYLLETDGDHDEDTTYSSSSNEANGDDHSLNLDSRCSICGRAHSELEEPEHEAAANRLTSIYGQLSHTEHDLIHASFDAFVTDVAAQLLIPALGSISFAIRQLDGEGARPTPESLSVLRSLDTVERIDDLKDTLLAMRLDAGLDHDRARSLLYNNRSSITATIFRQKWIRRFNAYLRLADLHRYDLRAIRHISTEFGAIKSELESATRDCAMSLQLNRYNILANYNRLLISWDKARFDIMTYILELLPLLGNPAACQQAPRRDDSEPLLTRLRAEFGDLSHRIREAQLRIGSEHDFVRKAVQAIRCFAHVVDKAGKDGQSSPALGSLVHSNERFFEVPSSLATALSVDADRVLGLFDQCHDILADTADSFATVMRGLSTCWTVLGVTANALPGDSEAWQYVFGVDLFATSGGRAIEPYVYLWHRHFPSISYRRLESCGVLGKLGITEMPTIPTDSIYRSCPDDELTVDTELAAGDDDRVDHTSAIARPVQDMSDSHSTQEFEHPPGPANMDDSAAGYTNVDTPSSGSDPESHMVSLVGNDWPRQTREYLPQQKGARGYLGPSTPLEGGNQAEGIQAPLSSKCVGRPVPVVSPSRRFRGHCNFQTIKDVNFLLGGYVASGSDDGSLFIWDRTTMEIVQIIRGDSEVVNAVECHPSLPMVAVSGIDSEVQIFSLPQGGPLEAHRSNFPLVRDQHFAEASISDCYTKRAYVDAVYARDPYEQVLVHSGHPALPAGIDIGEAIKHIPRPFPTVSLSKLWEQGRIVSQNEDMRLTGLANSSLTRQMMHNIMFRNMFGAGDDSDDDSDDDSISSL